MTSISNNPENRPTLDSLIVRCEDCPIRHRAVCSYASPIELAELNDAKTYKTYRKGEEIVGECEPLTRVGSVVHGVVGLTALLADGGAQIIGLLFPSDFLGRHDRTHTHYSAVALSDTLMCFFDKTRFTALLERRPSLMQRLLEMTLDDLDAAREWQVVVGRKTTRQKVASFVLMIAERLERADGCDPQGQIIDMPLTREEIADHLALTNETVSRQLTQLRTAGILHKAGPSALQIVDRAALIEAAGVRSI